MKKFLMPLLALVFLISCEKETSNELITEDQTYADGSATTRSPNRRAVCHNGNIININVNAISGHRAHGDAVDMDQDGYFDIDNPCSPTDCDDMDANVNPGATEILCNETDDDCNADTPDSSEEICDNGIDDDCDGDVDEADSDCSTTCVAGELQVVLPDGSTLYVHPTDNSTSSIQWGGSGTDIQNLPNFTLEAPTNLDFNGAANTAAIIAELGGGNYAANLCANLSTQTGCDWYLPAAGELNAIYQQLGPAPNNNFAGEFYWSSNEANVNGAYLQNFFDGGQFDAAKNNYLSCRCVRR